MAEHKSFTKSDGVVVALILSMGAWQFVFCDRAPFGYDDVFYADAAASLIRTGVYGIQGHREANQPPGLSAILALVQLASGGGHLAFLRTMVVCGTLGLLAAYALLRHECRKTIAGLFCLLLISSPRWFQLETELVFPAFPFLLSTFLALLALRRVESAATFRSRAGWIAASSALTAISILIASAGIALLGAVAVRIAITFFRDRRQGALAFKRYGLVLLAGVAVQIAWMHRTPEGLEWPEVPGYPGSYLAQLQVRNGNDPELGFATAKDVGIRVVSNVFERARVFAALILGLWVRGLRVSAVILAPLLLLVVGWIASIRKARDQVHDWYFAGHELIYLLWPWKMEMRFFIAISPLACLYLWRGLSTAWRLIHEHPRAVARVWVPCAALGSILSLQFGLRGERGHAWHGGVSLGLWIGSGVLAAWFAWAAAGRAAHAPAPESGAKPDLRPAAAIRGIGTLVILAVFLVHFYGDVEIALWNVRADKPQSPDVEAALWIRSHTDPGAVILARHVPIAHHVSQRTVVWFPPLSDPVALMQGIRRHGISYVVVADRSPDDYYLPPDPVCFARLQAQFPGAFRLVFGDQRVEIYQVVKQHAADARSGPASGIEEDERRGGPTAVPAANAIAR